MAPNSDILQEEFEVLESIFPDEIERISDDALRIRVEPEEAVYGQHLITSLQVDYPPTYPDTLPNLTLTALDGTLDPTELTSLLDGLRTVGEESIGMAMVFTLVNWMREELVRVLRERERVAKEAYDKRSAEMEEAEAARKRGSPVTPTTFALLRKRLAEKQADAKRRAEEARIRSLTPKEREEYKKISARPTGKQLFEGSSALASSDMAFGGEDDEEANEVDLSKYTREERERARREADDRREQGDEKGVDVYDSD